MATRRIEFNWGKVSKGLAKTVLKLGVGAVAGSQAAGVAGTIFDGFSLADGEAETTDGKIKLWLNRSLADAMLEIFAEAQKETAAELPSHVEEAPLEPGALPTTFLRDPWKLDVWAVAGEAVRVTLTDAGIAEAGALELCGGLADRFTLKLRDQWRAMALDGDGVRAVLETRGLDEACDIAEGWRRDEDALIAWPNDPDNNLIFSRKFPISKIYVPLRAYEVEEARGAGFDWDVVERRRDLESKPKARWMDLMEEIGAWLDEDEADGVLRFVSGGPGSGKSTFARMLAAARAAHPQWRVRFLQLHNLRDRDIWDVLSGKGEAIEEAMMDQALAGRRVLLILDGLDELTTLGRAGRDRALRLVDRLEGALMDQQDRGRTVRAVILGRDLSVQRAEREARDAAPTLHVQPLTAYASFTDRFNWQGTPPNDDLLRDWWGNVEVLGYQTPIITRSSKAGQAIADLKAQPVTNALLALYLVRNWEAKGEDGMDALLEDLDRATLYHDMLAGIHERDWGEIKGTKLNALEDFGAFLVFLEDVALACFQNDSRTASLDAVEAALTDDRVKAGLRRALEDSDSLPDQALMAFHVRLATVAGEERLEFTHKSFADYLLARRLLRAAREGVDLGAWARLFGRFRIEMAVVDFLRPEAVRQTVDASAMEGVKDHLSGLLSEAVGPGFPVKAFELEDDAGTGALARRTADAEATLLAALDAVCRSLDREVDGETVVARARIDWPDDWAAWRMIARQPPPSGSMSVLRRRESPTDPLREVVGRLVYAMGQSTNGNDREAISVNRDRTISHSRLRLDSANLQSADLSGANLEDVNLARANLLYADLRHANLRNANLWDADLSSANLSGADLQRAEMGGADLEGAQLVGANLSGADLERASLERADLTNAHLRDVNVWLARLDDAIMTPATRASLGLEPQPQDREVLED